MPMGMFYLWGQRSRERMRMCINMTYVSKSQLRVSSLHSLIRDLEIEGDKNNVIRIMS